MFGIGFGELLVIAVLLLVAVGPNRMPTLLKSVVKGYREFRKVTRDLRASAGIDQLMAEDFEVPRKPLYVPPKTEQNAAALPTARRPALNAEERARELPPEGVDIAHVTERNAPPEESARLSAKMVAAGLPPPTEQELRIIAAKTAAARSMTTEEKDRIIAAKIAAASGDAPPPSAEEEQVIAAKIAAAKYRPTPEEEEIIAAKIAAAEAEERAAALAPVAVEENPKASKRG